METTFAEAFNATIRRYVDADINLLGVDPSNPGRMPAETPGKSNGGVERITASQRTKKAIASRRALYGETKLKPQTVKAFESRGDNVRHHRNEKRGKTGRAN